ncbi:MAG: DUF2953 domain-containing protein [Lachnospiraceae bacterium]|nr:DUF2953 domain-containing protein [Lachnospiraceae bacterium]
MLQVILGILKILLWIILAILGLALLLILLVLFAPIKYKVDAKYKEKALVKAKISFLIASVRVIFDQETKKLDYCIRLAGIKLNFGKEKKLKKSKVKESKIEGTQSMVSESANNNITTIDTANQEILVDDDMVVEGVVEDSVDVIEYSNDIDDIEDFDLFDGDVSKDVPKEQRSLLGRIKAFFIGLKDKIIKIKEKLENFTPDKIEEKINSKLNDLKKKINKFKRFWGLKCTVKTRRYLKKYLLGLLKHIGPRKIKGYVRYGFGDPCKTGQITGYISMLPFVYQKHFSLIPDFYEKVVEADVFIKGRIRIGYILRIVLNINIWRTILVAKKIFKGKKKEV